MSPVDERVEHADEFALRLGERVANLYRMGRGDVSHDQVLLHEFAKPRGQHVIADSTYVLLHLGEPVVPEVEAHQDRSLSVDPATAESRGLSDAQAHRVRKILAEPSHEVIAAVAQTIGCLLRPRR